MKLYTYTYWYFTPKQFGLIWSTVPISGLVHALQYQLEPFDRIQRRAVRVVGDQMICTGLDTLALRRDVSSLCVLYRIYYGECSGKLFDPLPTHVTNSSTIHTIQRRGTLLVCGLFGTSFLAPRNCRMAYLRQRQYLCPS